jgi:hypothetical protein
MVNGIAVAVAGAVALQMLFAGVQHDYTKDTKNDLSRAQMEISVRGDVPLSEVDHKLAGTEGVRKVTALSLGSVGDGPKNPATELEMAVGSCAQLAEVARLGSCRDGDIFRIVGDQYGGDTKKLIAPGRTLYFDPAYDGVSSHTAAWKVPSGVKTAAQREDPTGYERGGLLVTSGALPAAATAGLSQKVYLSLDRSVADADEHARNTAAQLDPLANVYTLTSSKQSLQFRSIRTGLFVGATCVLVLIGASLLVSQLEQLRERKKLLSSLVAFGTRRRTLSLSVLWQTAIPIALGLLLASVVGLTLGAVLLKMTGTTVSVDWASVLSMTGIGAAVVLAVTVLSLPPLLRLMRPDGLRTE